MMSLELDLPPEPEAAALARHALKGFLESTDSEVTDDVCLLADELVANSLRHSRFSTGDLIRLSAQIDADLVHVSVCDPGSEKRPVLREATPDDTTGRGLFLIDAIAADWGVARAERTCVWFEVGLPA